MIIERIFSSVDLANFFESTKKKYFLEKHLQNFFLKILFQFKETSTFSMLNNFENDLLFELIELNAL